MKRWVFIILLLLLSITWFGFRGYQVYSLPKIKNSQGYILDSLNSNKLSHIERRIANSNKTLLNIIHPTMEDDVKDASYYISFNDLYENLAMTEKGINSDRVIKDVSTEQYKSRVDFVLSHIKSNILLENIKSIVEQDTKLLELNEHIEQMKGSMQTTQEYANTVLERAKKIDDELESMGLTRDYKGLRKAYHRWSESMQKAGIIVSDALYAEPDLGKHLVKPVEQKEDSNNDKPEQTNLIATLTFDDGPNPRTTPQVLDILKQYGIKATFFVLGQNAERYPELVERIHKEGHIVGNHSYSHRSFTDISDEEVKDELARTNKIIESVTREPVKYYRMPYGAGGERVQQLTTMTSVLWNVDSEDWKSRNRDVIVQHTMSTLMTESLILMHDIHQETVYSLPKLIEELQRNNYKIVRLDEMM